MQLRFSIWGKNELLVKAEAKEWLLTSMVFVVFLKEV